jgi:2-iminobutanoate/2-iminopropanoate deaminase
MKTIVRNPTDGIYRASNDYIHAIEVQTPARIVFVAGTMGLEVDGTPAKGLDAQLIAIWRNIRRILAEADMTVDNIVRLTTYLRDGSYAEANALARVAALGNRRVPTTAIIATTLDEDWLVEIEVIAAA